MSAARAIQIALWFAAALLLGATAWPFLVAVPVTDRDPGAARSAKPLLPAALADLSLPPIETFSETLNRPLFTATRRPPSPLAVLQGQGEAPPAARPTGPKGEKLVLGRYLLRGIVVTAEQKIVLLTQAGTNKSLRLKEGDKLDDWKIATVAPDHVVLTQGDKQEKVTLRDKK